MIVWRAVRTIRAGDAEQQLPERLGVAAQWRALVGGLAGGAGGGADVAYPGADVERQQAAAQPQAVGVQVAGGQVPQRVAELGVLEALFDLRTLAVKVLDLSGGPLLGRECR